MSAARVRITIGAEVGQKDGDSIRPVSVRQGAREESARVYFRRVSYGATFGLGECSDDAGEFITAALASKSARQLAATL